MTLSGQLTRVADITDAQRAQMYALMEAYYSDMSPETFEQDLREKQWVILLQEQSRGVVLGFSTQMLLQLTVDGQDIRALFSGDTIVAREHWQSNPLSQIWGRLALALIDAESTPLYWFLITKGYKTYRFLPVFFHEFYPRYDRPTPIWARGLIDALGRHKYPNNYDSSTGIIHCQDQGGRLRTGIAEITSQRLNDPHVEFFANRNPLHATGDELCCLAPLTRENFTPAAYRVIGESSGLVVPS